MTDTLGHYVGGGKRYLPPSVIQKMKKNMKKVPFIQQKSDIYHKYEELEAEKFLDEKLLSSKDDAMGNK